MGIAALEALLALEDITERQVDQLITACERLVDPAQMGGTASWRLLMRVALWLFGRRDRALAALSSGRCLIKRRCVFLCVT